MQGAAGQGIINMGLEPVQPVSLLSEADSSLSEAVTETPVAGVPPMKQTAACALGGAAVFLFG